MRKFFTYLALFIFSIYWGITFLYVAPKNPVSEPFFEEYDVLRYFFGQNWSLFVPPPKTNGKLYYTFYKKGSEEIQKVEVLASLLKSKSENAPFNASESIQDYFLSASQNNIIWWMENYQLEQYKTDGPETCEVVEEKLNFVKAGYYFELLKGYSLFVAAQNKIPINEYEVSFSLVRILIPEFEDRKNLTENDFVFKEELVFKSEKFPLTP